MSGMYGGISNRTASTGETLGVEEEYHLVDPATGELATRARDLPDDGYVKGELQASQLETGTQVCRTFTDVREELVKARRAGARAAARSGAVIMAAGTHPFAQWRDLKRVPIPRYDAMANRFGALANRQCICGLHVHVSVQDLGTALTIMNRARPYLPVLAALLSSSPFHEGVDTGFASFRTMWWSVWPTAGMPPVMRSVGEYKKVVADLTAGGLIDDASTLYWDVRPSIRYPTLEFRAADVCPEIDVAVVYAALVRSLVRTLARQAERETSELSEATITAARWRAAREGIGGKLCDPLTGTLSPAPMVIRRVLAQLQSDLREHGEFDHIDEVVTRVLDRGTSSDQQRLQFAGSRDLRQVVRFLVDETMRGVCTPADAPAS
jgi:YbdK family carboxylate-amine ligase